ncbi:UDP-N-acetylmuramoyl-tripeptide--D-alanyl-D-alanine ligase [Nocardioides jejuensis]|uniref:UDP-N-acetylmuramoyl-tripeptide--D-alanyl-D-alanine ligase n=1 Tax=Nocardioides jejuensis TaxID=2502782 RepID=A0A4R1C1T0_9ACTN|nr:UDP-N-acetylmuramoyl-tripeptide--D-alanyl-D-alanine ligase [Nocardioides jejuensis]TCJ23665.1 UDP-N-acetylmuramoyl-tripeptide--D-alanyl-D-alanine ligase [Nocardioides jejuensis]
MIPLRLSAIASVVGGVLHGDDVVVTAPAFVDSRAVEPGGLFVAIAGEHVDGHAYAEGAVAAGAAGVLGSRPTGVPTVVVDDPAVALGLLARHVRDQLSGLTVLALTGSQGKTGTKDFLAQILAAAGETVATAGNFNNELGVPLTVLRATESTRYLVVEMGARGLGHISYLCGIARPDIAAVINVGTAHLGEFGTQQAIAQAKGEIVEGLPADGVAVLNADDPLVAAMASRTPARVLRWGAIGGSTATDAPESAESASIGGSTATDAPIPRPDVGFKDVVLDELGRPRVSFNGTTGQSPVRVQVLEIGQHQVLNAAAALTMALAAGVDWLVAAQALEQARSLSRWRMEVHDRADGVTVINDAYNASPDAMRAAVDTLAGIKERSGRRTIAVLAEMRELGGDAARIHTEIGAHAATAGVDVLLVIGDDAAPMLDGASKISDWSGTAVSAADRAAALAWLRENVAPGDVVLVKASRGAALEHVADGLLEKE